MKLIPTDLKLLTEFIEYNSEHSRWSTAFTLLISITIASLIAFLGSFVELQDSNSLFNNQEPEWITINIQADSLKFITSRLDTISLEAVSAKDNDIIIKNINNYNFKYKTIQRNTENKNKKDKYFVDSLFSKTHEIIYTFLNDSSFYTFLTFQGDSNYVLVDYIKNKDEKIIEDRIEQVKIRYFTKKAASNLRFSAFQILSLCTTFLGFIFSIFFFVLRRKVEIKIIELNQQVERQNRSPEFLLEQLEEQMLNFVFKNQAEGNECEKKELDDVIKKYDTLNRLIEKFITNFKEKMKGQDQTPKFHTEKLAIITEFLSLLKDHEEIEIENQKDKREIRAKKLQEVLRKYNELKKSIEDLKEDLKLFQTKK